MVERAVRARHDEREASADNPFWLTIQAVGGTGFRRTDSADRSS